MINDGNKIPTDQINSKTTCKTLCLHQPPLIFMLHSSLLINKVFNNGNVRIICYLVYLSLQTRCFWSSSPSTMQHWISKAAGDKVIDGKINYRSACNRKASSVPRAIVIVGSHYCVHVLCCGEFFVVRGVECGYCWWDLQSVSFYNLTVLYPLSNGNSSFKTKALKPERSIWVAIYFQTFIDVLKINITSSILFEMFLFLVSLHFPFMHWSVSPCLPESLCAPFLQDPTN